MLSMFPRAILEFPLHWNTANDTHLREVFKSRIDLVRQALWHWGNWNNIIDKRELTILFALTRFMLCQCTRHGGKWTVVEKKQFGGIARSHAPTT
jgi:hypothetical protein